MYSTNIMPNYMSFSFCSFSVQRVTQEGSVSFFPVLQNEKHRTDSTSPESGTTAGDQDTTFPFCKMKNFTQRLHELLLHLTTIHKKKRSALANPSFYFHQFQFIYGHLHFLLCPLSDSFRINSSNSLKNISRSSLSP